MKKIRFKRFVSAFLAYLMVVNMMPTTIFAAIPSDLPEEMVYNNFMDALSYTGYNVQAQIDDGTIFKNVAGQTPSSVLSGIGYGTDSGSATGLETTSKGLPDIQYFREHGSQCGGYVTYVLFNYLPNVAGVDTSYLTQPKWPLSPGSYHEAADKWVADGYATKIYSAAGGTTFSTSKEIPIGSLVLFAGPTGNGGYSEWTAGHVALYAGKYKGVHYIYHIGNSRGPELSRIDWMEAGMGGKNTRYVTNIYAFTNDYTYSFGQIEVNKKDVSGNNLSGAVFQAIHNETGKVSYIGPTNSNGYAISGLLPFGTYTVKETVFPSGYTSNGVDTWTVVLDSKHRLIIIDAVNEQKTGSVKVVKSSEDKFVSGIKFHLYGVTSYGTTVDMYATTDSNGVAWFNNVPITDNDELTLEEVDAPFRYNSVSAQDVTVKWNETVTKTFNNTLKKGYIELYKTDEATGGLLSGAQFGIYSDIRCEDLVQVITTDENGYAKSQALPIGVYYVKELKAPTGYIIATNSYEASVNHEKTTTLKVSDIEQKAILVIFKEGEVLKGFENGKFVYENGRIPGVTFMIEANEDIYRADGTKLYDKGDVVEDDLVTGLDGTVTVEGLHIGSYAIYETDSVGGYTINFDKKVVDIEYEDQTVKLQYKSATVVNKRQVANVSVSKVSDNDKPLRGAIFTLYAGNDIVDSMGNVLVKKDAAIEEVTTNTAGEATFTADIPIANSYYIKETKAPAGYIRSDEVYSFSFNYLNETTESVSFIHKFVNVAKKATLELNKVDSETGLNKPQGDAVLSGAVYGVYATENIYNPEQSGLLMYEADELVIKLTTDKAGYAKAEGLIPARYYVAEIKASEGYEMDDNTYDVDLSYDNDSWGVITKKVTSKEQVKKQPFELIKMSDKGELLAGAGFKVYLKSEVPVLSDGSLDYAHANSVVVDAGNATTAYTDANGYFKSVDLPYGTYIVKEVVVPNGYSLDGSGEYEIEIGKGADIVKIEAVNYQKTGTVRVVKSAEDNFIAGVKFHLYGTSSNDIKVDKYAVTDSNGVAIFEEVPVTDGNYVIEEIAVPSRYETVSSKTVTVEWNKESSVSFKNVLKKGYLDIVKKDSVTGKVLKGAEYGIYSDKNCNKLVEKLTTDEHGYAKSKPLPIGIYYVKELKAPAGYVISSEVKEVNVIHNKTISNNLTDNEQLAKITIIKQGEVLTGFANGKFTYELGKLSGVRFKITAGDTIFSADGTLVYEKGAIVADNLVTSKDGTVSVDNLHLGKYVITETASIDGFVLNTESKTIELSYKDQTVEVQYASTTVTNNRQKVSVDVFKKDGETKKPLADASFGIYAGNDIIDFYGNVVLKKDSLIETLVTDANGKAVFNADLPALNSYYVRELKAPTGYVGVDTKLDCIFVTVGDNKAANIEVVNTPVKGSITIEKTGDVLMGYEKGAFVYSKGFLEGGVFEVYAAEDIISFDKVTKYYSANHLVAKVITDAEGIATIENLPLGKYKIVETKAPYGFVISKEEYLIELKPGNNALVVTEKLSVSNDRQKIELSVIKKDADSGKVLSGAKFGLYAVADILDYKGNVVVKAGTLLESAVSNDEGIVSFSKDYPFAKYVVKELAAPVGYATSSEILEFYPEYVPGRGVVSYSSDYLDTPTRVEFIKVNIEGSKLEGAHLTLLDSEGNVLDSWISKSEENYRVNYLEVGKTYTLREQAAPYGYLVAKDVTFTVLDTADVQMITMCDDVPTGKIIIRKTGDVFTDYVDGSFVEESCLLAGAVFEVYDDAGNLFVTITTDENGVATAARLPLGKYTVVEVNAPDGYLISDESKNVELSYIDDKTAVIETTIEFDNARPEFEINLIKIDESTKEPLAGAEFGVFAKEDILDQDGNVMVALDEQIASGITDANGEYKFKLYAPYGKYYLKEIKAPTGYVKSEEVIDLEFAYVDDSTDVISVTKTAVNKPITVEFTKTDITGEVELQGAKLSVFDSEGNLIETWESTTEPHIIKYLIPGEYVLREEIAPFGYQIATDVAFTVLETGEVQKVSMKDEVVTGKIVIKKTDVETEEALSDAVFEVKDANGNVVATIMTDATGYAWTEELPIAIFENGVYVETIKYYVQETIAPAGYKLDETIYEVTFDYVDGKTEVLQEVLDVTNEQIPHEPPKTGDSNRPLLFMGLMVASALMLVVSKSKKKETV